MGAAGHGFHLYLPDIICLVFSLLGIFMIPKLQNHSFSKSSQNRNNIISAIILAGTLIIGISVFFHNVTFKYGNQVSYLELSLFYVLPVIFIFINSILIFKIIQSFRN